MGTEHTDLQSPFGNGLFMNVAAMGRMVKSDGKALDPRCSSFNSDKLVVNNTTARSALSYVEEILRNLII